jgi:hypothetical protein
MIPFIIIGLCPAGWLRTDKGAVHICLQSQFSYRPFPLFSIKAGRGSTDSKQTLKGLFICFSAWYNEHFVQNPSAGIYLIRAAFFFSDFGR